MEAEREFILQLLTAAGVICGGIFAIWKGYLQRKSSRLELKTVNKKREVQKEKVLIAKFIASTAVMLSRTEGRPLGGRHFSRAKEFYLEQSHTLGHEPKVYPGLFKLAKKIAIRDLTQGIDPEEYMSDE